MSTRLIASQEVMNWIDASTSKEDCDLCYMINDLKQALIDTAMLQVDIDEDDNGQLKRLQSVNAAIVHALRNLNSLYEEVEDQIIPSKEKKGGATQ